MSKEKHQDEGIEILEDPNVIVDKANEFLSNKRNKMLTFGIIGVLALIAVGLFAYNYYIDNKNKSAQEELFQAQFYFESDSLNLALNGDGNSYGFLDIIDKFGGTKSSNIANFYAGVCYMKLKDFEGATRYLKDFSSSDFILQARAYSLIGDAYMEQDNFSDAISYFKKAANYKPNASFSPVYLTKLAIAQENNGDVDGAIDSYTTILEEYPKAQEVMDAKKHKARLEAKK